MPKAATTASTPIQPQTRRTCPATTPRTTHTPTQNCSCRSNPASRHVLLTQALPPRNPYAAAPVFSVPKPCSKHQNPGHALTITKTHTPEIGQSKAIACHNSRYAQEATACKESTHTSLQAGWDVDRLSRSLQDRSAKITQASNVGAVLIRATGNTWRGSKQQHSTRDGCTKLRLSSAHAHTSTRHTPQSVLKQHTNQKISQDSSCAAIAESPCAVVGHLPCKDPRTACRQPKQIVALAHSQANTHT